jgi:hypothetical protein
MLPPPDPSSFSAQTACNLIAAPAACFPQFDDMSVGPHESETKVAKAAVTKDGGGLAPQSASRNKAESIWEISQVEGHPSSIEQWTQAVEYSADACLYHRAEIAPLFLEPTAHQLIFVECRLDGKLVGGAILVVTRYQWHRFFERRNIRGSLGPLSVPPFVVNGLNAKTAEAVLDRLVDKCVAIAEALRGDFILFFDAPISPRVMIQRPIQNRYCTTTHWSNLVMYDYVIDLRQDHDTLWKNVSSGQRGCIKKARGLLQVATGGELPGGKEAFAELMESMYLRENLRLLTRQQLHGIFDTVYAGTFGQTFFCLAEGKPVCTSGIARDGKIASYLHGARSEDAMNGASSLSLWSGIEWAKRAGCEWFELGGIIPERNRARLRAIGEFKRSFGGQIIQVHGGKQEFRPRHKATYDFVDAWGVQCKALLRKLNPFRK